MQQNILITGISRGLGKELFKQFAARNYFVFGVLRNKADKELFQKQFPENTKIILADLSSDSSIEFIQKAVGDNPIDLLINNAGIGGREFLIENIDSSEISELFNIHCLGAFRTVKAIRNNLIKAQKPIILNLNSRFGSITRQANGHYKDLPVSYSYKIAKAAQNMLTNCIRAEFQDSMEVISLHPGKMKTEIAQSDANLHPEDVAKSIVNFHENGKLKEVNGIMELGKGIIEW